MNKSFFGDQKIQIYNHPKIKDIIQWDNIVFKCGAILTVVYIHDSMFHVTSKNDQYYVCETGTIQICKGFSILYDSNLNIVSSSIYHSPDKEEVFELLGPIEYRHPRLKDKIQLL